MLTSLYLEVDFGVANTGLATVGYTLYNAAGGVVVVRATAGVAERGSSGVYGVTVPTILDTVASIVWDTGGGSPLYASEDIPSVIRQVAAINDYQDGAVWYDDNTGSAGTEWPIGSGPDNAVDNYADLDTILTATGLTTVRMLSASTLTPTGGQADRQFVGPGYKSEAAYEPNNQTHSRCVFSGVLIDGGGTEALNDSEFNDCDIGDAAGIGQCTFTRCRIGSVAQTGVYAEYVDCYGQGAFDMAGASIGLARIERWSGTATFDNMGHASSRVFFSGQEGRVVINVGCTLGQITVQGVDTRLTDNNGGTTVFDRRGEALSDLHGVGSWETALAGFDAVYCDPTNGADINPGTPSSPVLTLAQAITNAAAGGLSRIIVTSDTVTTGILLAVDPGGISIVSTNVAHQINMSAVTLTGTTFVGFEITGTYTPAGAGPQFHNCSVSGGDVSGTWYNSRFSSTCTVSGGAVCIGCESILFNNFNLAGGSVAAPLLLLSHSGDVTLSNCADGTQLAIVRADGYLELNLLATISDISLEFGGNVHLVDSSTGGTITDYSIPQLVDDELTAQHGLGAWTTGTGLTPQQARDAMKLAPTAGAPAAGSVDEHLDDILADTADMQPRVVAIEADTAAIEPLTTANLDATVSSRATQADILSDATPFPGANIDATITSRESDVAAAVRTSAIQADIAALALSTPSAADIADAVLEENVAAHSGVAGSFAELLEFIHDIEGGRWVINTGTDQMEFYKADNVTLVATMDLKDLAGSPTSSPSSVTERTRV